MKEARSQKATPGFNAATGTSSEGYSRGANRFAKNQWSGHSNDGRLVDMGRGPTKGNDGTCGHSGMAMTGAKPPTSGVPAHNPGKDMFTGSAQVRNPGGTRAFMPSATQNYKGNADSINVGRGPTKGNQQ
jgi:hypothetical protein